KVERLYSKIAIEIEKHSKEPANKQLNLLDKSFRDLKEELIKIKPERSLFIEKFESLKYTNSPIIRDRIRYILTQINNSKTTGEHIIDFTNVNIVHVLPKTPTKWSLTKNAIKLYVNKLGNLTLLHHKINSDIGNDILSVKLPELEKSEIQITKEFVVKLQTLNKWEEEDILTRQKQLSEESYDIVWNYW
nr:HNH endonuclease family protein [Candidatus Cloacimonadota bacterium]